MAASVLQWTCWCWAVSSVTVAVLAAAVLCVAERDLRQSVLGSDLLPHHAVRDAARSEVPGHHVHEAAQAAVVAHRLRVVAELHARQAPRHQTRAAVRHAAAEGSPRHDGADGRGEDWKDGLGRTSTRRRRRKSGGDVDKAGTRSSLNR